MIRLLRISFTAPALMLALSLTLSGTLFSGQEFLLAARAFTSSALCAPGDTRKTRAATSVPHLAGEVGERLTQRTNCE